MIRQRNGAMFIVDWENIRRDGQLHRRCVRPAELCQAMRDFGYVFRGVVGSKPDLPDYNAGHKSGRDGYAGTIGPD